MHDRWLTQLHPFNSYTRSESSVQCSQSLQDQGCTEALEQNFNKEQGEWQFLYSVNRLVEALGACFQSASQALAAAKAYVEKAFSSCCGIDEMYRDAPFHKAPDLVPIQSASRPACMMGSADSKPIQDALGNVLLEIEKTRKAAEKKGGRSIQSEIIIQGFEQFHDFRALQERRNPANMSSAELRNWLYIYEFLEVPDEKTLELNALLRHFLEFGEAMYEKAGPKGKNGSLEEFLCSRKEVVTDAMRFAEGWLEAVEKSQSGKRHSQPCSAHIAAIDFLSRSMLREFSSASS